MCGGGVLTCLRGYSLVCGDGVLACVCEKGGYSLVCGGGGTLCTGLEFEDGRVLLPAPWFPPPFT